MLELICGESFVETKAWTFPGGERNIRIVDTSDINKADKLIIACKYSSSDDLVDLILLVNACRIQLPNVAIELLIPYFPFARQDRATVPGEAFALEAIVNVIKSLKFSKITVFDPHSSVLVKLFEGEPLVVFTQEDLWYSTYIFHTADTFALVSPDKGAYNKTLALATKLGCSVITADKLRNPQTGQLSGCVVHAELEELNEYSKLIVVDDICDGGGTFIQLANEIREIGYLGDLVLCVTHGIFSKGLEVLEKHFDLVLSVNNMSKEYNACM